MFGLVLFLFLSFAVQPGAVSAQAATGDLRAVGLIEMAGLSGCTGTLVRTDLVLTAGHCLLSRGADGGLLKPGQFVFYPTDRLGNPGAGHPGQAVAVHPLLLLSGLSDMMRVRHDLGLIRLALPVPASAARPLSIAPAAADTGAAFLLSFRGRGGGARRQRDCPVAFADGGVLVLSCNVVRGESGAPLVLMLAGRMAVVGVVSSRATTRDRQRALAAAVAPVFDGLLRALQTGQRR